VAVTERSPGPNPSATGTISTRLGVISDLPPDTKIVILHLDQYVFAALKAGAVGFLLKDMPARRLVEAVRSVVSGGALLSPGITLRMLREFARRPPPDRGQAGVCRAVPLSSGTG
jgi:DNA-binding NarL/FixJ family response regulator